jgi:hypothetical protein
MLRRTRGMHASEQLTDQDKESLGSLERKLCVVRDRVEGVARGYFTALYIYGPGGMGKSHTVLKHLEHLDVAHKLFNSRMTAKGLFMALWAAPDAVHVLEDMERLTRDRDAQGVLRSCSWAQPGHARVCTWTTADGSLRFEFRGGLIMTSNRPLADLPELRALATRIEVYRLEASDAELTALMRKVAADGYSDGKISISAEECREVTEFLLKECKRAACPLDLRLQVRAFRTYVQWAADCTVTYWQDLISAMVREAISHFRREQDTASAEVKRARRRNVVREIVGQEPDVEEQMRIYKQTTACSRADFFRRKAEVESGEFDDDDRP